MGYLISTNKALLEALQLKIHNYMKANVIGYNADRWATVRKHPTENKYAVLIKETDPRLPYNAISKSEKLSLVDELSADWTNDSSFPTV